MKRRPDLLPFVLPLLAAGVLSLGALLSQLPGRGVDAPLVAAGPGPEPGFSDYFATGVHLLQIGLPREAASAFETAGRLRPHVAEARVNLGYAYLASGNYSEAEGAFRVALDLKPQLANGYFGWAQSLEALGDLPAALGAMRTFVHLSAEDDPYRRRALAAIWEWETTQNPVPRASRPTNSQTPPATLGLSGGKDAENQP